MDLFRLVGCSELKFRYMCLSVSLVCNLVYSLLLLMFIIRSRKAISVGEIALVNLMVGWTVFKCFMNSNSESLPHGQIMKNIIYKPLP